MGGAVSTGSDNDDLVDNLISASYIKSPYIEHVFRAVDRADYFLHDSKMSAYKDLAWKSGNIHISAPCIYSEVMENLKLSVGLSFLNVGSGTGYLSTMVGLILGPTGVNHGVEIHADVVKYAYEKLDEFKKHSQALDKFEFCDPVFVTGNGLCLPSSIRQYDRVYCGAACPDNHENYMKNLIKVGGILVMPHNDQLLQITRVSQTKWERKCVLPVSFSTLLSPSTEDAKLVIVLPESEPLSLQASCRSCIRSILRSNAEKEFPDLCKPPKRRRKNIRRKRHLSNILIPLPDSSEEDVNDENDDRPRIPMVVSNRAFTAVFETSHSTRPRLMVRCTSARPVAAAVAAIHENSDTDETIETSSVEGDGPASKLNIPKREKFDSGISEDVNNDKSLSSEGEDSPNLLLSDDETMDFDDFDLLSSPTLDTEASKLETEDDTIDVPTKPELSYGKVMRAKIHDLPLPPTIKAYLNFYREF